FEPSVTKLPNYPKSSGSHYIGFRKKDLTGSNGFMITVIDFRSWLHYLFQARWGITCSCQG
ncbi:MAG: hypothetical protein KDC57_09545, partial [Saprospiraceae bacterium]|nr:hypothetical protein [Saprospiraceae bacterium]